VLDLEFFQYSITIASIVTLEVKSCLLISLNMVSVIVYVNSNVLTIFSVLHASAVLS